MQFSILKIYFVQKKTGDDDNHNKDERTYSIFAFFKAQKIRV